MQLHLRENELLREVFDLGDMAGDEPIEKMSKVEKVGRSCCPHVYLYS